MSPSAIASRCFTVFAFLPVPFFFFDDGPSAVPGTGVAAPEGLLLWSSSNLPSPVIHLLAFHLVLNGTRNMLTLMVHVVHTNLLLPGGGFLLLDLVRLFGFLIGKFGFLALNLSSLIIIGQP
jgi:hypothetical protein